MPHVTSQLGLSGATHALFFSKKNWVFRASKINMSISNLWCFKIHQGPNSRNSRSIAPVSYLDKVRLKVELCSPNQFSYDSIMFDRFLRARGSWIWSTATVTLFICPCWWTLRTSGVGRTSFRVISSISFTAARQGVVISDGCGPTWANIINAQNPMAWNAMFPLKLLQNGYGSKFLTPIDGLPRFNATYFGASPVLPEGSDPFVLSNTRVHFAAV